jgi:RNA polymerase sigma-70 factor (ECF subfamily)
MSVASKEIPVGMIAPVRSNPLAVSIPTKPQRATLVDEDLDLVTDLQGGDEEALKLIMERYKDPLYGFIFRHVGNRADAAEILEETFVKVFLNRHRFKPKAKFRTWLYTIATNLCRDWARRHKRKPATPVGEIFEDEISEGVERDLLLPRTSSPSANAQEAEEAFLLRQAIDSLPHDLKTAIILFSLEEKSQDETAQILGCSSKAVETRVYRAKRQLKALLGSLIDR